MKVEIAVQDVEGAVIARNEGADRVELCMALGTTGGLTPSYGLIEQSVSVGVPLGVQVLIRPRSGSFIFSDEEKEVQIADVRSAILAGAAGVVVGGLLSEGGLDLSFARDLANIAHKTADKVGHSVDLTFHRAFDMANNMQKAIEQLIDLGYTRILTSGGAPKVPQGIESLTQLVQFANNRIEIQAGGGLTIDCIEDVIHAGVHAIHLSAKHLVVSDGGPGGGGDGAKIERTNPQTVRDAVKEVRRVLDNN